MLFMMAHLHITVVRYKCIYNNSIGSEFRSDVRIALTLTIKKIADRWTFCFHSKGALSNGGGAHWLSRILWQLNEASDVLLGPH